MRRRPERRAAAAQLRSAAGPGARRLGIPDPERGAGSPPDKRYEEFLARLQQRFPQLDIGSYPFFRQGKFGASFVLRGTDDAALKSAAEELRALIRSLNAEPIEGEPQD